MNLYIVYYHLWNVEIQYSDVIFQNFVLVRVSPGPGWDFEITPGPGPGWDFKITLGPGWHF